MPSRNRRGRLTSPTTADSQPAQPPVAETTTHPEDTDSNQGSPTAGTLEFRDVLSNQVTAVADLVSTVQSFACIEL